MEKINHPISISRNGMFLTLKFHKKFLTFVTIHYLIHDRWRCNQMIPRNAF